MSQMTAEEFEQIVNRAYEIKQEKKEIEELAKKKEEEFRELEKIILANFEHLDKSSHVTGMCLCSKVERSTVTVPKDPEKKEAFWNYLKENKYFDALVTVNHQTLNAFYNQQLEIAKEEGNYGFEIPGLDAPKTLAYLTFRRK